MSSKNIFVLCEDLYEEMEMWYPYYRLMEEGHNVFLVGTDKDEYKGKHGYPAKVDKLASEVKPEDVDAVVIPGGFAPDKLRQSPYILNLVKVANENNKIIAAICHGPWVMISANILRNKRVTSYYAIRDDVVNSGAGFMDESVVVDGNLITSRMPKDLPDFTQAIIAALK